MTKVAILSLSLAVLAAVPVTLPAQENPSTMAVNEAVLRQANTIVLRKKLVEAKNAEQRNNIPGAAKLYQECWKLVQQIGSGVEVERAETIKGLARTRLTLAREYERHHDLRNAEAQVEQVLRVEPKNPQALAFKSRTDRLLAEMKGKMPDKETVEKIPQIAAEKTDAGTQVQDGKLLYEMGKLKDAQAKLDQALKLDPGNRAAYYYLNLIQQAKFARESAQHTVDTQQRMAQVEKRWVLPSSKMNLPVPNPYATNQLVYTGPGRQAIIQKLNSIRLNSVSFNSLPLSEVLRTLSEQSQLRDPKHEGVNFLINPNPDKSGAPVAAPTSGGLGGIGGAGGLGGGGYTAPNYGGGAGGAAGQQGAAPAIDPATGLPIASGGGSSSGNNSGPVDVGSFIVNIPKLNNVRLADVLDAIVMVCDHPIQYSVQDYAVVFSAKGPQTPELFSRTFKVDPNTFYSGLESVSAQSFGSTYNSGSSGSGGTGGGGGGGGGGNNQNNGAVVGVVNAFAGAGSLRNTGNGGGGGGGGGGTSGQGSESLMQRAGFGGGAGGGAGGGGGQNSQGGLSFVTRQTFAATPSELVRAFFTSLGVNLDNPPGKSVFFNDRLGLLFVKATQDDLNTIEQAIEALNQVAPQVQIKARFIEVSQNDNNALGFDWYLGQFNVANNGAVVGSGGSSPSLTAPTSASSPLGAFPGSTAASIIGGSANDQLITSGLRNSAPAIGTITGILTNPQFRMVIHALQQRSGYESLAEPEVTTTSGRQTQMRATQVQTVITGVSFQQGTAATTTGTTGATGG